MTTQFGASSSLYASDAAMSDAEGGLPLKGSLTRLDSKNAKSIVFMFNPKEYTIKKRTNWTAVSNKGFDAPQLQFASGGAIELSMQLFFDTFEQQSDVRDITGQIFELTLIDKKNKKKEPPVCLFAWGKVLEFPAIITSVSVRYTLFLPSGTPVRATMDLSLKQGHLPTATSPQNPTSKGIEGNRTYIVKPGDTIDRIAYEEYHDPNMWRYLADTNQIDDPENIKPGQILVIDPVQI